MTFPILLQLLKKNLVSACAALVLLACCAFYFARSGQISQLEVDLDDSSVRRTRMLKNLKFGTGLPEDLASIKELMGQAEERLFSPGDLAGNQRYFYQLESATGVKLQNLQQIAVPISQARNDKKGAKKAAQSKYQEISYEMNVVGTYESVLTFLRHLEEGSAFYRLEGLSIARMGAQKGDASTGIRLGITILGRK